MNGRNIICREVSLRISLRHFKRPTLHWICGINAPGSRLSFGAVGIDTDNLPKQQNQDGSPGQNTNDREQMVQVL